MDFIKRTPLIANSLRDPSRVMFTSLLLIYLATLTSDYYWDGITFALQIEKVAKGERGASLLFHQNHLLYNGIGYLVYTAEQAIGISLRALNLLQIMNAIAGAAAVGVFFRIAQRATGSRYAAVVCSFALALSAVWWKLATDADAYILSILLILVCANNLLSERPRWYVAAPALAGAMLIHQLASLFFPAALVALFLSENIERKWRFGAWLSSIAWAMAIGVYYVCAALLHDIGEPIDVVKWAVSNQSGVSPSLNPLHGLSLIPRTSSDLILGHDFGFVRSHGSWIELCFALAAFITATVCVFKIVRRAKFGGAVRALVRLAPEVRESWKHIAPVLITWVGMYLVFLIFWEPWQTYYRAFYAPALLLLFGLALSNYHRLLDNAPSGAAALAVAALVLFNLAFFIVPHMRTISNTRIAAARKASKIWNERTVIYFADHTEVDTTFEYLNEATTWRRFTSRTRLTLDSEIQQAHRDGGRIWLNKGVVESADPTWLRSYARGREIRIEGTHVTPQYVELLPPP